MTETPKSGKVCAEHPRIVERLWWLLAIGGIMLAAQGWQTRQAIVAATNAGEAKASAARLEQMIADRFPAPPKTACADMHANDFTP